MDTNEIKTAAIYCIAITASQFFILWLSDYSGFNIPEIIPVVELRTYGIFILIATSLILYLFQTQLLKLNKETSIIKLVFLSFVIVAISFLIYQIIRQLIVLGRPLSTRIIISASVPALCFTFMAASMALSLKKANGILVQIPFILCMIIVYLARQYLKNIEW